MVLLIFMLLLLMFVDNFPIVDDVVDKDGADSSDSADIAVD